MFIAHQSYTLRPSAPDSHIRKVDANGIITNVAGDPTTFSSVSDGDGGAATQAHVSPNGIAVDDRGNLFFADGGSLQIRWINANGIINSIATNANGINNDVFPATQPYLQPRDVALDSQGRLYIADAFPTTNYINRVLRVDLNLPVYVLGGGVTTPQSATLGVAFSTATAYAFQDPEGRSLTFSSSSLPPGLSINANTGVISGTPTKVDLYGVTVGATDDGGSTVYSGFYLTVNPAGNTNPGTGSFAITGASVSCAASPVSPNARLVSISPQYSGLNGSAVTFSIDNESLPTTQAGPYTVTLYNDNPVVTLRATQSGTTVTYRLAYQAQCSGSTNPGTASFAITGATVNCALSLVSNARLVSIAPQYSGLNGSAITFSIDNELVPTTQPGPYSATLYNDNPAVTLRATQSGVTVSYRLAYQSQCNGTTNPGTGSFAITGATVSCAPSPVSPNARLVSIAPQYSGLNGSVITFSIDNESRSTTQPSPYTVTLYNDNTAVTLRAIQSGVTSTYRLAYQPLCNGSGRVAGSALVEQGLSVRVLGNPTQGESAEVEVVGAEGQSLKLELVDSQGRIASTKMIEQASGVERQTVQFGRVAGVYLLRVSTPGQKQTVRIIRQ